MAKFVDVEHLLQWAYRELLKARPPVGPAAPNSRIAIASYCVLGTRVDVSSPVHRAPYVPHPDALILDSAVRELPSIVVVADSAASLLDDYPGLSKLGVRAVKDASFNMRELVQRCAKRGARPPYDFGRFDLAPAVGRNGKAVLCGTRYAKNRYSKGAHHKHELMGPDVSYVMLGRAQYVVWQDALCRLVAALQGQLQHHVATGPQAPPAPWRPSGKVSHQFIQCPACGGWGRDTVSAQMAPMATVA